ncbi:MAG: alpha/beta fold hydrolase, partial [Patescibacteria group bacterium]|nr:alpha/beta fold hydrolase [Patescibacteria group bacterium]
MAERVTFSTADGVAIVGDHYAGPTGLSPAVVLLHMLPAERASWAGLARALQAEGFQALAIDLRGHGESVHQHLNGSPPAVLDYKKFS